MFGGLKGQKALSCKHEQLFDLLTLASAHVFTSLMTIEKDKYMGNINKGTFHTTNNKDRMGIYLGTLRNYKGITLGQLSLGVCSQTYLNRIEHGEREADILLTDLLLQRLGESADQFIRILDQKELTCWDMRKKISSLLLGGDLSSASKYLAEYASHYTQIWHQQYIGMISANILYLQNSSKKELCNVILQTFRLTQPEYDFKSTDNLLLSHNEGQLLYKYLQLQYKGVDDNTFFQQCSLLYHFFDKQIFSDTEKLYLVPYLTCDLIQYLFEHKQIHSAAALCERTLELLTQNHSLHAYSDLLSWYIKIQKILGQDTSECTRLLQDLNAIYEMVPQIPKLWLPFDDTKNIYDLNQVIKDRRKMLGLSQEELAFDICDTSTLSRIEQKGLYLQKDTRKKLLQKVNMSGERYDYEIISNDYSDYLTRKQIGNALNQGDAKTSSQLLPILQKHAFKGLITNQQYLDLISFHNNLQTSSKELPVEQQIQHLWDILHVTLPLSFETIDFWPICSLSINEVTILIQLGTRYKRVKNLNDSIRILSYVQNCLQYAFVQNCSNADLYMLCSQALVSSLGDTNNFAESDSLALDSILSNRLQNTSLFLSDNLYSMAWNLKTSSQQPLAQEKATEYAKLINLAYSAALISNDTIMKKHILNKCGDFLKSPKPVNT